MGILGKFWRRRRKYTRISARILVLVKAQEGDDRMCRTEDVSETGLRIDISEFPAIADLTGGNREVRIGIVSGEGEEPIQLVAEPIWTTKSEHGTRMSGWMFCEYPGDTRERLLKLIQEFRARGGG